MISNFINMLTLAGIEGKFLLSFSKHKADSSTIDKCLPTIDVG